MMIRHVIKFLMSAFNTKISVELRSGPGLGKTSLIHQTRDALEEALGEPVGLITEHLSSMESVDLRGLPHKTVHDGKPYTGWTVPSVFPSPSRFPEGIPRYGILFLDEYLQAPIDTRKPAARLILERALGDYSLDDYGHWVVWSASNDQKHRSGATKDLMMEINRKMLLTVDPDLEAWLEWAEMNDVHYATITFAKQNPQFIFNTTMPEADGPFATPRSLVLADRQLREMAPEGEDHLLNDVGMEVAASLLGESVAAAFSTHVKRFGELPTYEEIIEDPKKTKVPSGIDNQYLVSQMCAFRVTAEDAMPVFQYMKRLPEELQVMGLRFAIQRTPAIVHDNEEFTEWLRSNKELLFRVAEARVMEFAA